MGQNIKVILGSVRTNRAGIKVAHWVMNEAKKYSGKLNFELIDLKELNLPFMDEPVSPMSGSNYVNKHTKVWSKIIKESDGFIFITPEYNHGVSPVLKNALDFLYEEWTGKPVGIVGYGGSGARDSIRQLREVINFIGLKPLEDQIGIGKIWEAFDENETLNLDEVRGDIHKIFAQLETTLSA